MKKQVEVRNEEDERMLLTGHARGLLEDPGYLGVHFDEQVPLLGDVIVSPLDGFVDPLLELVAADGVDNIDQILSGEAIDVQLVLG